MTTDTHRNICPKCQSPIPSDAPGGLCPKCVLAGVSTTADQPRAGIGDIPSIEQLAALFPQLEVIELIGRGGMGFVFKARQLHLDREVALKLLPEKLGTDPHFADRFAREARVLAKLNHPNIVMVHDFGHVGGFYYLTMEYVEGLNLRQAMRMGKFSPAEALAIVPKICDALQFAHEHGVLHRDIKPENLLLDLRGRIKIADFGIAKLIGEETSAAALTGTGASLGTPHYMAPEQFENPSQVDHRADIYSLGVVFYEMLTGELPLGRFSAPSTRADLDERIDAIVLRALARERDLRQKDARELQTEVEGLTTTVASTQPERTAVGGSFPRRFWRAHRNKLAWSAATMVFLFLIFLLMVGNAERRRLMSEYYSMQNRLAAALPERPDLAVADATATALTVPPVPDETLVFTNVVPTDPEKLQREEEAIRLAHENYDTAKSRHSEGEITDRDLALANRDLLIAEARGDALKIATANYEFITSEFMRARQTQDARQIWENEVELSKAQHAIERAKAGTNVLEVARADLKHAERTLGAAHRLYNVRIEHDGVVTNGMSAQQLKKFENDLLYAQLHFKQTEQSAPKRTLRQMAP
jgi:serine/threonine protein kinase